MTSLMRFAIALGLSTWAALASGTSFYEGKSVRMVVGFSAGGGFDTYARIIARHLPKHLPGASGILVENMPGAGTLVAAGYIFNVAKPDGLTIGMIHGNAVLQEVLGLQGIQFDSRRFNWVGAPNANHYVCALTKASGVSSLSEWLASSKPLRLGATAPGDSTSDVPRILSTAIGLPVKIIDGHKGTPEIQLAMLRGDLDGVCMSWETVALTWMNDLKDGKIQVVVQMDPPSHPSLLKVPVASELAKSEEARQIIDLGIVSLGRIGRLFTLPPNTPKDRVLAIRSAFMSTLKDPDFLAEMNKANLPVEPVSAEEIGAIVGKLHSMSPKTLATMKEQLLPKK